MVGKKIKRLPIGISSFKKIVDGKYIYADKSRLIYQMITSAEYYFLSRPRRFGKSLLISTLYEIFSGHQELFKDLWIYNSDYDWQKYPVIKIDFSGIDYSKSDRLEKSLLKCLHSIAKNYGIKLSKTESAKDLFSDLIDDLSLENRVVILVDEYDKPIIDNIYDLEKAEEQRRILQNFYSVIKAKDEHLRFVLFTGVSKFSKTSVFSGINNLLDISMDDRYAIMLGYTHNDMHEYFKHHIDYLAEKQNLTYKEALQRVTDYYDGYQFAQKSECVFNPFSVLLCFDTNKLDNYWFETGTPTFLIHLLQNNNYDLESITHPVLNKASLGSFEPTNIPLPSLLFQTGYLTIKNFDPITNNYTLGIPNKEVANGLTVKLADAFTLLPSNKSIQYARLITHAFNRCDILGLQQKLQEFFDRMPYTVHIINERNLQFVFYSIFSLIGVAVDPEVTTSLGRADLVVSLPRYVYIIELKFNKSAESALEQIEDRRYYEKYLSSGKQIILLGIGFDKDSKIISLCWDLKK